MKLDVEKEYNLIELFINFDDFNSSKCGETVATVEEIVAKVVAWETTESDKLDVINKFYIPYVGNKLTQVVR